MLCRVTAVSRFAALAVVLVCIGQATASLHLQVHHSGLPGNTSAANTTTGCLTYSNETACVSNTACAWNPSTGVCTNSSSGNSTNGNSTNCVNGTSLNSTNCNSTNGNSTTNGTDCIFHETEAGCLSNASCVWNPATGICYTNNNSSSGNSTTNGTDCTFLYTDESSCDANASCIWDPAEAVCLTKNSTTNGTDCSNHMTAAGCLSNASCVWDPVTVTCYTNTNSSSGNSTNGNSTNCVNGTSLNSTNCNSTNGNSTNGNSTMKAGRSSVRGVNRHCQAARTAKHCVAKAACYWDAIGLSCREAVVGAHAVASDRTTSHLGSTSARSAGGAHGRDIAAPVVGGVLAVASVVGVALLRLRRGKKSLSTGGASDAAERVPIVRVCDDNTANE